MEAVFESIQRIPTSSFPVECLPHQNSAERLLQATSASASSSRDAVTGYISAEGESGDKIAVCSELGRYIAGQSKLIQHQGPHGVVQLIQVEIEGLLRGLQQTIRLQQMVHNCLQ